jgi:MFS family permease
MAQDPVSGSRSRSAALALLFAINLFNYLDRQILAAVLPEIRNDLLHPFGAGASTRAGFLATGFLVAYMLAAPLLGRLADRFSRWHLIALSIALWSLSSGWSGLAGGFTALLLSRMCVGIGEAGYGPAAPALLSDLYPLESRGRALALFSLAMPVGGALGYLFGGYVAAHWNWRMAFILVVPPGLLLALLCLRFRDATRIQSQKAPDQPTLVVLRSLFSIPSYRLNCAAMTAMTFTLGGIAFWMPDYIIRCRHTEFAPSPHLLAHVNMVFGGITVVAGLLGTLIGSTLAEKLRPRFSGAYFLVSGIGIFLSFPALAAMLWVPFPTAWIWLFLSVFFLFLNTGPSNTALANVTPSPIRSTAFAYNILVIHALGDAISPPLIGWMGGIWGMNTAFLLVGALMVLAAGFWLLASRHLAADTSKAA